MLGWLYFRDVENYFQFLFTSFAFGYRYGLELPSKFFPQPKLACYYRPRKETIACTCKSKQMLRVTPATQEFKVVCQCILCNVYIYAMTYARLWYQLDSLLAFVFSCQLGWVVVDGIPPAPSMSLCQEESTRRLDSNLQSHTGPMDSHHFEKREIVYFVHDSFGSDLLKPALHFFACKGHKN